VSSVLPTSAGFAVAAVAAALYLWGVRRVRRWPLRDTVAFLLLGVGSLVAVSAIAPARFPAYAVEVMALLLVVPFLMALGHPLKLALGALPPGGADRLRRALANPVTRLFAQPIVGPLMLAVLPFGVFFTALLPESLAHPAVLALLRLVLLAAGITVLVPLWESQSLETRIPLLDHRIIEFAWSLPSSFKQNLNQGKWLLRQILYQYVPRALVDRPKRGFGAPVGEWLRGPLRDWAEDLLGATRLRQEGFLEPRVIREKWEEHLSSRRDWSLGLWHVLMFQAWREHRA